MYLPFQHGAGLHNNNVQWRVKPCVHAYRWVTKQQGSLLLTSHTDIWYIGRPFGGKKVEGMTRGNNKT